MVGMGQFAQTCFKYWPFFSQVSNDNLNVRLTLKYTLANLKMFELIFQPAMKIYEAN